MGKIKHWPTGDLWLGITSHARCFPPYQTAPWRHHQPPEEALSLADEMVAVVTSGEGSKVETTTLVAIMAAKLGRQAGEMADSRQVSGGEESGYQMGHRGRHEAEDVGKLQEGLDFRCMIEIL